jgi:hypothetical protein
MYSSSYWTRIYTRDYDGLNLHNFTLFYIQVQDSSEYLHNATQHKLKKSSDLIPLRYNL